MSMTYKVTLNGKTYEVQVEKGEAILIDEYEAVAGVPAAVSAPAAAPVAAAAVPAAPAAVAVGPGEVVAAPLPGNILNIKVSQGQAVKKGDLIIIIEAMKMENEILAPRDGVVAQVVTSKGSTVETGTPLIVLS